MGNNKMDDLLISLEDEIDRKCFKIREMKKEIIKKRLFWLSCLFFFLLPFLFLYFGTSLLIVCLIVISFLALSMIALLPVMFKNLEVS
jgi:hypothetical protein